MMTVRYVHVETLNVRNVHAVTMNVEYFVFSRLI